jgi:hypothetical protein
MSKVKLNGNSYVVSDGSLNHGFVARQSPAFRTQGIQQRSDDPSVNRFVYDSWKDEGVGTHRLRRNKGSLAGAFSRSSLETRFDSVITLLLLPVVTSHATPADFLIKMANFNGDFWGLFDENFSSGAITDVVARKFGATSDDWTGGGTVVSAADNAHGARALDLWTHAGVMYALTTNDGTTETVIEVWSSTDGVTWTTASGTGFDVGAVTTTQARRNIETFNGVTGSPDDFARGLSFGENLMCAVWDNTNSEIHVQTSTNTGTNWATKATIPSAYGPKAFVIFRDPFTAGAPIVPVLVTSENAYIIDIANTTFSALLPTGLLSGDQNDGRWSTVGADGALYIPVSWGDIFRVFVSQQGVIDIQNVGPGTKSDGFTVSRLGRVSSMLDMGARWLAVGYGADTAAKEAAIYCMDYATQTWHTFYLGGGTQKVTALGLSTEDDGTTRFFATALNSTTASVVYQWEEPLVSPLSGVTQNYAATGYIEFAEDDLGDPQTPSTLYQVIINADGLSATATTSDEFAEFHYGIEGGGHDDTDLGTFLSGDLDLSFATGTGVAAKTIFPKLKLFRNTAGTPTTTKTPKVRELEIQAEAKLLDTRFWPLVIDIEATAQECPPNKVANVPIQETIIANLETVTTSKTQVSFQFAENISAINVKVPNTTPPMFNLRSVGNHGVGLGHRTGTVSIRVEEGV